MVIIGYEKRFVYEKVLLLVNGKREFYYRVTKHGKWINERTFLEASFSSDIDNLVVEYKIRHGGIISTIVNKIVTFIKSLKS